MKTKSQIIAFLKTVKAKSEVHKLAILGYCKSILGVQVNFDENKEESKLPEIGLEEFKEWIEEDISYRGMVIYSLEDGLIGIVDSGSYSHISVSVFLDSKGILHRTPHHLKRKVCREAKQEEKLMLQHKLYEERLGWNRRKHTLFALDYELKDNQQVRLSLLGQKLGLGVFKEVDKEGQLVMYCVKMEDESPRYSLHEIIGPVKNFQVEPISTYERRIFSEELKKCGIVWNGHLKAIDYIRTRVAQGENYYYVNEFFEVTPSIDMYRTRDTKRWEAGNYFTRAECAERFCKKLQQTCPRV